MNCVAEVVLAGSLVVSPGSCVACSLLLKDDTSLSVDLHRVASHEMRVVVHYEEAGVDDALPCHRDVVEHIGCCLVACSCVDVSSELCSDTLEVLEEHLVRKVLCSVEAHMLEEVSKAVLLVCFLNCSDVSRKVELGSSLRKGIVADVVSHTVFKLSYPYSRVVWKRSLAGCNRGSENGCDENKQTFHSNMVNIND